MESIRVLRLATAKGVRVFLEDGRLMASPGRLVDDELRSELKAHREAVTDFLTATQTTMRELLALAQAACDRFRDGHEARAAMREACLSTPPELLDDLLMHFRQEYGPADLHSSDGEGDA